MATLEIAGRAGRLEALLDEPAPPGAIGHDGRVSAGHPDGLRAAVVLAHPHTKYGGTMHTKVVYQTAKALSRIGCAVLRFNFRGAGASPGTFTDGPGEKDDFRTAVRNFSFDLGSTSIPGEQFSSVNPSISLAQFADPFPVVFSWNGVKPRFRMGACFP